MKVQGSPTSENYKKPKSFAIAQKKHKEYMARKESEAINAGMNAVANGYVGKAFQGAVANSGVDMYAGVRAMSGNALSKDQVASMHAKTNALVPKNYQSRALVSVGRGVGNTLGFAGTLNPAGGLASGAGDMAIRTVQNGGSAKDAAFKSYGGAFANVLGGKLAKGPMALAKAKKPNFLSPKIFEEALGYAAGKGLTGAMNETEDKARQDKPKSKN